MRPRPVGAPLDSGEGAAEHTPHQRRTDGVPYRHRVADEDVRAGGHRSAVTKVLHNRTADGLRQGQLPRAPDLAARDAQSAPVPVEVLEAERDHLAGSQAEVDLTAGHGVVTEAG